MGFLFFGRKDKKKEEIVEYKSVISFNSEIEFLLAQDKYIARSDYKYLIDKYNNEYIFFFNTKKSELLSMYCKKNKINEDFINKFLSSYEDIKDITKESNIFSSHNEKYLNKHLNEEKKYLDNILKDVDPVIMLDDEQRKVVLSDEDYSLVIAGAGAGKTTTVAAKVRYLVEKKGIDPKEILVISFTNKAVGELKEKINDALGIKCPITTFHSSGYAILRKNEEEKKKIVSEGMLFNAINNYLKREVLSNEEMVDKIINFFGTYFDIPYEGNDINKFFKIASTKDFSTLKSNIGEYNQDIIDRYTGKHITINNETLRSAQEVQIANFLFTHGIEYEYEAVYPYHILKAKKPYTPDFKIKQGNKVSYIEHFGISEEGKNTFYSQEELDRYIKEVKDKVELHKKHKTDLIFTFSSYKDKRSLLEHLEEKLIKHGYVFNEKSKNEIFEKLINTEENKYILKFVKLMCDFINNFKTNGYTIDKFYEMKRNANVRSKLFLDIARECYLEYEKELSAKDALDFQDLINDSASMLHERVIAKEKLGFKYIIVDEYQDISKQRFDLTKELSNLCDAKIIAVGDDWQSIYAFSGSDITLFTKFANTFGYAKELKITKTYRNAQEVIDIAGNFVQKNESQIKKSLISPKRIDKPILITTYDEKVDTKLTQGKGGKYYNIGKTLEEVIGNILENNEKEKKSKLSSILLIGRFGFDARNTCFSNDFVYNEANGKIFSKKYPNVKIEFLTAHSSKGLGYDNVVIVNARNEMYGFPSKIEDDPVMTYVTKVDNSIDYAEERRLFYVALTRTKNRVYIVTPKQHPSEFILELIKDYPNVSIKGDIEKNTSTNVGTIKKCPCCGYPLQLRWNKNYGLKLWICMNEPELCGFISNELNGNGMSIHKCTDCKDGYLLVRKSSDGHAFLGCSNYKPDGTGCGKTVSYESYAKWLNNKYEIDESVDKKSYLKEVKAEENVPISNEEIKPLKKDENGNAFEKERKKTDVHKTKKSLRTIEKEGFNVIVDDEDNILTDMELLQHLRTIRNELAKQNNFRAYHILMNDALVSLATFKPTSREEFIDLYGLSEAKYEKYGLIFIKAIEDFYKKG